MPIKKAMLGWLALCLASVGLAVPVSFVYAPPPGVEVRSVSLRGVLNNWSETPMKAENGRFSLTLDLSPGRYAYKFFINGTWPQDMCNDATFAAKSDKGNWIDPQADGCVDDANGGQNAFRLVAGEAAQSAAAPAAVAANPAPPLAEGLARVHYFRPDGKYEGWGLHLWMDTLEEATVTWAKPFAPTGQSDYGLYWDFRLKEGAKKVGFIVHKGDEKDPGPDMFLDLEQHGREIWVLSGSAQIFKARPDTASLPKGDLAKAQAHWLSRDTIAWNPEGYKPGAQIKLYYSLNAGLKLSRDGLSGGFSLTLQPTELSSALKARFPHLSSLPAFKLAPDDAQRTPGLLKVQTALAAFDAEGKLLDATSMQIPGVLDDLFYYAGPLGVSWQAGKPTLRVWAPTARSVNLLLFDAASGGEARSLEMQEQNGVWSIAGEANWKNKFYLYEVRVFVRSTGKFEVNRVTDPYSLSLSANSQRSQIVDIGEPALKPSGWDALRKPPLEAFEDIVLYELHVRDFSAFDNSVAANLRGTFRAFTTNSAGMQHLRKLAQAGLTHVHLLPAFDFATVNENKAQWKSPGDLSRMAPNSQQQQAAVNAVRDQDGFNWGYDPLHFNAPEGSYATNPNGSSRILEFREMVAALSRAGLRTVMDVVYNHTSASGQSETSVLDRIVPGYYHRLNKDGNVETSTCCQNTATEHRMMEKLMIDSVLLWAKAYKVDGFRFDLMGHHMKSNLEAIRKALDSLTLAQDGVDGKKIYVYGEGWNFGEVAGNARGLNATQLNMPGSGIGTFNDRLRDAVRGGGPFGDPREQGFATGLFTAPSAFTQTSLEIQRLRLLQYHDWIKVGLAGGLRDYRLGPNLTGGQVRYGDAPAGYTLDPQETINYVSAHDNETLFDAVQLKAAANVNLAERIRMNNLALALTMLSQGIPFFHAGDDILRSKSMDRDSYNSGDWFNRLDWSYQSNGWGLGLPIADKNQNHWPIMRPLLGNPALKPNTAQIQGTAAYFQELLRLRKSSPLFRLRSAEAVQQRLRFYDSAPGVIVMGLEGQNLDPAYARVLVVFNATAQTVRYQQTGLAGNWRKHPIQEQSVDTPTRAASYSAAQGFVVPARTAAVYVVRR